MSTLGKGEATYIFLRLAYAGSHLQVPSMLPRLLSYVQACCEAVNILETFVGVSKLPVEMNGAFKHLKLQFHVVLPLH